jgi:serine/threonine protein kinase/Tol biopolymer transport system component
MGDLSLCESCGGPLAQTGVLSRSCPRCMVDLGLEPLSLADDGASMVGQPLAHYRISGLLGAGGMGVVWKATDTRLGREVALKMLAEDFHRPGERPVRFEREAKLLASLNHPNIAAIHGLDEDHGIRFLVLELVEGETLADQLSRGAIPLDESLKLARQIGDALEAAHEKGIVHRDLKPGNIKIAADGTVKVLDFGLAKAFADEEAEIHAPGSRPRSIEATQHGMILGTAAYMAPEQARGTRVDKRVDIWAFGAVLYEMVTGTRAFPGTDPAETMASVVTKEPDFDRAPARVRRLLRKCLEKEPKNRLRDIADAWELVDEPLPVAAAQAKAKRRTAMLPWTLASALGTLVVVFLSFWPNSPPRSRVTFQIQAPTGGRLPLDTPAVSNDGRVAYTATDHEGVTHIYVFSIETGETRVLLGTEGGASHPVWSPADDALLFAARQRLKRLDLSNGSVRDLIGVGLPGQTVWNPNDDIVARVEGKLFRISGDNSAPISNSSLDTYPAFLPDSRRFLALANGLNSIQLGSLDSGERTLVIDNVLSAPILAPTPSGKTYLLFQRDSHLFAQEFDEVSGKVLGTPEVLIPNVGMVGQPAVRPTVGVSASGTLAYQNHQELTRHLTWVDRSGAPIDALSPEMSVYKPRLSPDESFVVGTRPSGAEDIWMTNLNGPSLRRLTFGDTTENFPVWSSDGSRVAYLRSQRGIYAADADGVGESQLTETPGFPWSWSGKHLLYGFPEPPLSKLYMLDVTTKEVTQVGSTYGNSLSGVFSPDGNYFAFSSDKSGRHEVYVKPVTPGAGETPVSFGGGREPRWNGDGTELFFVSQDGYLMAAGMELGKPVAAGPTRLFPFGGGGLTASRNGYDVARDGQRFLIATPGPRNAPITVVLNWWVMLE